MSDFSNGAAYVDDQLVPIGEAKISILDWGLLHSDATYDVAHVWKGKFFRLDDHIDRFRVKEATIRFADRQGARTLLLLVGSNRVQFVRVTGPQFLDGSQPAPGRHHDFASDRGSLSTQRFDL